MAGRTQLSSVTIGQVLREVEEMFKEAGTQSPRAEAETLLAYALPRPQQATGLSRSDLMLRLAEPIPLVAEQLAREWAMQMANGRSLQHLTGYQVFLDHDYLVDENVLIPRPETEGLVLLAEASLRKSQEKNPEKQSWRGLELGLGSGVISIELLSRFSTLTCEASEISPAAALVAKKNAHRILGETGAARLRICSVPMRSEGMPVGAEIFRSGVARDGRADFLVSNPPYLKDASDAESAVAHQEPSLALFAPTGDPIFFYRNIAEVAHDLLSPEGWILVEIASDRGLETAKCFEKYGWRIELKQDLTGRDRYLYACRPDCANDS